MAPPRGLEPLRAASGAGVVIAVVGLLLAAASAAFGGGAAGLLLIAPLGATAFLLFVLPNSPLAQPWSAVIGNTVSALVAVGVLQLVAVPAIAAGLSVLGAILAMALLRALHPPGAAVALSTVFAAETLPELGFGFALLPVMAHTVLLVVLAMIWNAVTGRTYPARRAASGALRPGEPSPPPRRPGPDTEELVEILRRFDMSANIGTEDFARLIAAAQEESAQRSLGGLRCADVMVRDVISVRPDMHLGRVADLFRAHGFKSLPVTDRQGRLLGLITQNDLITRAREDALAQRSGFAAAMARLVDVARQPPRRAGDIMAANGPTLAPHEHLGAALRLLVKPALQAVPVVESDGRVAGIITRTDLLIALAQASWATAPGNAH